MTQLTSTRLRARNHNSIRGRRRLLDADIGEELRPLASNTTSELDVFGHYGDPLGVYGAEIGVLEESDEIRFRGHLERGDGGALEAEIGLEILRDLADKALEGSLRMRSSVLFWYLRISLRATVPGRKRWGFLTPPVAGADFRAAFVASCFRGAFPPVDLRAVCFVLAISARDFRRGGRSDFGSRVTVFSGEIGEGICSGEGD
ncbi:hypothetical protein HPP92_005816 [Vanilla planifolia]|uniref:Uncharacterized protein n=1 Tax=Vanilla planifolia TaxID=51239 RepID=A0A835S0A6_VANPL|nr:hypothetical protein HPP92_005816 [Vanilla planifolia]